MAVIIEVYCVFCKKKSDSTLVEIKSGTSEKGKKYNMAKGKCVKCEKSTCMILSQKGADEYNEKLKEDKSKTEKLEKEETPEKTTKTVKAVKAAKVSKPTKKAK